jgi:hypothetical protein
VSQAEGSYIFKRIARVNIVARVKRIWFIIDCYEGIIGELDEAK